MSTYINEITGHQIDIYKYQAPIKVKDYLFFLLAVRNLSPKTINMNYCHIRTFIRWFMCRNELPNTKDEFMCIDIEDFDVKKFTLITVKDLYEYFSFLDTFLNVSSDTKDKKLKAMSGFFEYLISIKELSINPFKEIKSPKTSKKLPVYLSLDECKTMINSIHSDMPKRDFCIITILLNCGLRLSELVSINISNIRDDKIKILGKGSKERMVYLNKDCLVAINECMSEKQGLEKIKDIDALFISKKTGKRLTDRRIQQIIKKILEDAGLDNQGYSPHKLRHTMATQFYQHGTDLLELQQILGHSNISTTTKYAHLDNSQIKNTMDHSPFLEIGK